MSGGLPNLGEKEGFFFLVEALLECIQSKFQHMILDRPIDPAPLHDFASLIVCENVVHVVCMQCEPLVLAPWWMLFALSSCLSFSLS